MGKFLIGYIVGSAIGIICMCLIEEIKYRKYYKNNKETKKEYYDRKRNLN